MTCELKHKHTVLHETVLEGGIRYETCDCGATRRIDRYVKEGWHTCGLCTHSYWRDA